MDYESPSFFIIVLIDVRKVIGLFLISCVSFSVTALSLSEADKSALDLNETWNIHVLIVNDSFGPDHAVEWDDGRTAGFELLARAPWKFYLELGYSIFTRRASAAQVQSRVDTINASLGFISDVDLLGGRAYGSIAAGGLFLGNFGGFTVQYNWHKFVGQERPIPPLASCDAPAAAALFTGEAGLEQFYGLPLFTSLAFSASTLGSWEAAPALGTLFTTPHSRSSVRLRYSFTGSGKLPPTAARSFEANRGPWVDAHFGAQSFYISYSINPMTQVTQGALGFVFSDEFKPSSGAYWDGGFRMDFAITPVAKSYVNRITWTPRNILNAPWHLGILLDVHSGWKSPRMQIPRERIQKTLVGAEWTLSFGRRRFFEPYVSASLGYAYVKHLTLRGDRTPMLDLDQAWFATIRVSTGIRLSPFVTVRGSRSLHYGVVLGGIADFDFGRISRASARLYLGLSFADLPASSSGASKN